MTNERDNFQAGLFVLLGIVLALVVVFTLADFGRWFEKTQEVKIAFKLSDGVQGLRNGASVTLGDEPIGVVKNIDDIVEQHADGSVNVIGKQVTITMPERYRVRSDAVVELKVPVLGTGTKLNIRSLGEAGTAYQAGDVLSGDVFPNPLASQLVREMGIRDEEREHLRAILANTRKLSDALSEDVPQLTASLKQVLEDVRPLAADARAAVADARAAVADARSMVAEVRNRSELWMDRIDHITGLADQSLARIDTFLKDEDPVLRQTLDNVHAITHEARQETMHQVRSALEKANVALANARDATTELKTFVVSQKPVLERTMANFQLTAAQLKLASIEVRRSPWRLLYTPSDKELETDNLYDAARSFALAATAIDSAYASLNATVQADPHNLAEMQRQLDYLQKLFERFETAEKKFWERLEE